MAQLTRKNLCPMLKKKCIELDCAWYIKLTGTDPQDASKTYDDWGCAITWQVAATLEVAKRLGSGLEGVQKATESFRNAMLRANEDTYELLERGVNGHRETASTDGQENPRLRGPSG